MHRDWPASWFEGLDRARVLDRGVLFPTWHADRRHGCYIPANALERLAGRPLAEDHLLDAFRAHRRRIHAAAHALLGRGTEGVPLLLTAQNFDSAGRAKPERARPSDEQPAAPCAACQALHGQPAIAAPHERLRVFGASRARGAHGQPSASRAVFQCGGCRHWLSRPHASTPREVWRIEPPSR